MGIDINFNSTQGIVQTLVSSNGAVTFEAPVTFGNTVNLGSSATLSSATGISPFTLNVTAVTAATGTLTLSQAGVVTLSGSTLPLLVNLPSATDGPGANFIIRSLSQHAHVISGSGDAGAKVIGFNAYTSGSKYTLSPDVNSSVSLQSNGAGWVVIGQSFSGSIS